MPEGRIDELLLGGLWSEALRRAMARVEGGSTDTEPDRTNRPDGSATICPPHLNNPCWCTATFATAT